ncbi:DUF4160 domain-containing protein [Synechococcus elongatus]|uniref:DUF4160 domain-containing protein n=1 Tax=Synechococcus elongatus TaxID=32046 RepID=UPI000F70A1A4|nr:DUF4160 domain-containing protein [Synechococcus elongatus PCC 11801]QFZ91296.1 DUF4160 domain-containing protein [Synechococcus elongatus PCC 11802]
MPKVFEEAGIVARVYPQDHYPAHVHVETGNHTGRICIDGTVRVIGKTTLTSRELKKALVLVQRYQQRCLAVWEAIHGESSSR